eukprot:GDKJ01003107.1.p1 GENE.GDKJ01003107.1~~GDKJ01003107.1.p1  ORF type:complete len:695 (+),score=202.40 GDKJ01003107.1:33-2117(+)
MQEQRQHNMNSRGGHGYGGRGGFQSNRGSRPQYSGNQNNNYNAHQNNQNQRDNESPAQMNTNQGFSSHNPRAVPPPFLPMQPMNAAAPSFMSFAGSLAGPAFNPTQYGYQGFNPNPAFHGFNAFQPMGGFDRMDGFAANLRPVDFTSLDLTEFRKNFYSEHPNTQARSEEEVRMILKENEITTEGFDQKPILTFDEAGFPEFISREVIAAGFIRPTPIQQVGWPAALSGRDMVGIAQTGSGKTLAYLLPAILHIRAQPPLRHGDGPIAMILAPTRELAVQIQKECIRFGRSSSTRSTCCYGGHSRAIQSNELRKGVEIVIATPGRLLDLVESKVTNLHRVTYLVLDEADRMLDMGFEQQMRKIVSQIRPDRQTLMWSATWPKEIQKLAHDFLKEPVVKVMVGSKELQANTDITQVVQVCSGNERDMHLLNFLTSHFKNERPSKVLIFCEQKKGCDFLSENLNKMGFRAIATHGDKEQRERDRILADFKSPRVNILIATDVASRGLDIKNIEFVVNYDAPKTIEDYIHRIGRTGRAGAKGTSVTYFTTEFGNSQTERQRLARDLVKVIADAGQEPPEALIKIGGPPRQEQLRNMSFNGRGGMRGGRGGMRGGHSGPRHYNNGAPGHHGNNHSSGNNSGRPFQPAPRRGRGGYSGVPPSTGSHQQQQHQHAAPSNNSGSHFNQRGSNPPPPPPPKA